VRLVAMVSYCNGRFRRAKIGVSSQPFPRSREGHEMRMAFPTSPFIPKSPLQSRLNALSGFYRVRSKKGRGTIKKISVIKYNTRRKSGKQHYGKWFCIRFKKTINQLIYDYESLNIENVE